MNRFLDAIDDLKKKSWSSFSARSEHLCFVPICSNLSDRLNFAPSFISESKSTSGVGARIQKSCLFLQIPSESSNMQEMLSRKGFNGSRPSICRNALMQACHILALLSKNSAIVAHVDAAPDPVELLFCGYCSVST